MSIKDILLELDEEVATVVASDFEIEIIDTTKVPTFDDPNITYDNLDVGRKKCKRIESCVLYVDIRGSAKISASRQPQTLAKMYSSFVRSMIACGRYFGGHVRNIIGDRVMVVFDSDDCFKAALDTAVLMNTVSQYVLNKRIKSIDFKCGIGIDYGKMLITKSGAIRQGAEKEFYRSLVWLGKPANTASRLTDIAFKTSTWTVPIVRQGNFYPNLDEPWLWMDRTYDAFLDDLKPTSTRNLEHRDAYFCSYFKTTKGPYTSTNSPILITEAVYNGVRQDHPEDDYVKAGLLSKKSVSVRDYSGVVYGGDIIFNVARSIFP